MQGAHSKIHHLADLIHKCIDLSDHLEDFTLQEIIKQENNCQHLTVDVVEKWLRALPAACTIPYKDNEIRGILDLLNLKEWTVDDYWRWCASRVLAFALYPKAYA